MTRPGLSFIMKIFPNIAGPKMLPYPNSSTLCKMCTTCDLSFINNLIVLTHWPKTGPLDLEQCALVKLSMLNLTILY